MLDKNLKENIYTALKELGLSPQEIDLYLTSLSLGSTSITKLSKNIGVSRPNIYKLIHGLELHGLADFSAQKKYSRDFMVKSPTLVLEKFRRRKSEYEQVEKNISLSMPELLGLYAQGALPSRIKIFESKEELTGMLIRLHTEETESPTLVFGSVEYHIAVMKWVGYERLVGERIKKGIELKMLLLKSLAAKVMKERAKEELREVRFLKGVQPFSTAFQVFSRKVLFWQPFSPLAILIEDEYFVAMFRSIFNKLWDDSDED